MSEQLSAMILEFKALLENGDQIDPDVSRRLLLALSIDTHTEVKKINGRLKKVEKATEELQKRPSLLMLFHQKPKTMIFLVLGGLLIFFIITQALWHYGLIPSILEWLNLPPLTL